MIWLILAANAVSILCVVAAALLALKGAGGWGWFLLVAALCATTHARIKHAGDQTPTTTSSQMDKGGAQ